MRPQQTRYNRTEATPIKMWCPARRDSIGFMIIKRFGISLFLLMLLTACTDEEAKLQGLWKHTDKAAWISIDFEKGIGSGKIARHDDNVETVGLSLFEHIQKDRNFPDQWQSKIYSAEVDGYINATIRRNESGTLIVSTQDSDGSYEVLRLTWTTDSAKR